MISKLTQPEIQQYITNHAHLDISQLALTKNPFPELPWSELLNQIQAKKKAKDKLPTWYSTQNIIYPNKISIEQTSSETTATYKAQLINGNSLIDLTGGFGIDDYFFSKSINRVVHCEINEELSAIVAHNFKVLNCTNITTLNGDSTTVLKNLNQTFDWIYIDPSRRNDAKGKVFMLKDCLPNVPELLDFYFDYTNQIMIKTAPILDLSAAIKELQNCAEIHIVAVENEVKELLFILKKESKDILSIKTTNILKNKEDIFEFKYNSDVKPILYSHPKKYLFEPNAAIMKSSGFEEVAHQFNLEKLHQHSHLYTFDEPKELPGRVFKIQQVFEYNKSNMKQFLENQKTNLTIRNFPDTVENIRKKWNLKDGGSLYTFLTTDLNNAKIVLLCEKI